MKWEELTSRDIESIDKDNTVVILPVGSIEVHGPHLPLGTDTIMVYHVVLEAARREGAIVLPPLYYAYVPENRHFPGTISLKTQTFLNLLEDILDEVSRHGFKKLLIVNGHGGNRRPLRLFIRMMLERGKRVQVYILADPLALVRDVIDRIRETKVYEHACEIETSIVMFLKPSLVKMERVRGEAELGRRKVDEHVETMVDWQGYAVMGYVGDPTKASEEKGKEIVEHWIKEIARIIRVIKEDTMYEKLLSEYYSQVFNPKL